MPFLRLYPVLLLALTLLVAGGCDSGGDDGTDDPGSLVGSFRVDGTLYTTENLPASVSPYADRQDLTVGIRSLTILSGGFSSLTSEAVHAIMFVVTGVDEPGTYTIDPDVDPAESSEPGGFAAYLVCDAAVLDDPDACDEGADGAAAFASLSDWTLTVTDLEDDRLAGRFEFVGTNEDTGATVSVEGQFNLPMQ